MGSHNVVVEARSCFFGVGLNAYAASNTSPPNPCRHARSELRDRLIDGSFAVWRVHRCSYNRSLAGRSGSRPRNSSMNRSRYNRGWLASLGRVVSRPGYRRRSSLKDGVYLMVRARLSENRSTAPCLREGDLLVANLLPMSRAVHQVSFVVRADGRF